MTTCEELIKAAHDMMDNSWFNDDIIKLTNIQQKILKEDLEYCYNKHGKKGIIMRDLNEHL